MITHHEDTADQIHGPYRWRYFTDEDNLFDGTAEEAASAMHLAVEEVEWACEEYGRCDTTIDGEDGLEEIVCWKPGPVIFGTDNTEIAGGFEWPVCEAPANPDTGTGAP